MGGNYISTNKYFPYFLKFTETTSRILKKQKSKAKLNLILFIESAQGMLALPEICKTAWQLSIKSHFTPDALVFGSDDYIADIGNYKNSLSKIPFCPYNN